MHVFAQATPTDVCILHAPKFSNTASVGKTLNFNQVRGRFTLPPSSFFFSYALQV